MRCRGLLDGAAATRLHDHLGWVGHGRSGLDETARAVFTVAAPDERLLFLPRDGDAGAIGEDFAADLASGRLTVLAADEAYEPLLVGGAGVLAEQLRRFDEVVDDALDQGYAGLRIVADNTATLLGSGDRVARWLAWEQVADRWLAERPVAGNCWFDRDLLPQQLLDAALCRHPASVGAVRSWRLGYERAIGGGLHVALAGSVDAFDVTELVEALGTCIECDGEVEVSLAATTFLHHSVPFALAELAERTASLRLVAPSAPVARLLSVLPPLTGFAA